MPREERRLLIMSDTGKIFLRVVWAAKRQAMKEMQIRVCVESIWKASRESLTDANGR